MRPATDARRSATIGLPMKNLVTLDLLMTSPFDRFGMARWVGFSR